MDFLATFACAAVGFGAGRIGTGVFLFGAGAAFALPRPLAWLATIPALLTPQLGGPTTYVAEGTGMYCCGGMTLEIEICL